MKITAALVPVLLLALLAGCASMSGPTPLLDPVGPLSGMAYRPTKTSSPGYLKVFTRTERRNSGGIDYFPNTPYSVFNADGTFLVRVMNSTDVTDQAPAVVDLRAGLYFVKALSQTMGTAEVPVLIMPDQMTLVNVQEQGSTKYATAPGVGTNWVRLPGGWPVGRAALFETNAIPAALKARRAGIAVQ